MAIHLSCLYDDENPETYEGIELRMALDAEREVFNTGEPFHDYLTANFIAFHRGGPDACVMHSSSVDHFAMDGGEFPAVDRATDEELTAAVVTAKAYLIDRGEVSDA